MLEKLESKEWLKLNASLQTKKSKLRGLLKEKGVLQKGGENNYDHYKYFSEAQYKELFTELFNASGLELKFTEIEYTTFDGTEKQSNGRMPKLEFRLFDTETGFYETTVITGEAMDKGDKAGYKAYTGALKYYLANTFMVATGDDPEKDSPSEKMNTKKPRKVPSITDKQKEMIIGLYESEEIKQILITLKKSKLSDLTIKEASDLISSKQKEQQDTPGDFWEAQD